MPNPVSHAKLDNLREELGRLARPDPSIPQGFTQAVKGVLTAMDYQDLPLVRSAMENVLQALRDATREAIEKRLGWPKLAGKACQDILEALKGCPCEDFDEVGKGIE